ncbi:IS66 family transposase [Pseudomonas aeruginosa]|nr:IS66 family transposase [Pseudomonas aeruginosa]
MPVGLKVRLLQQQCGKMLGIDSLKDRHVSSASDRALLQQHEATIAALTTANATLTAQLSSLQQQLDWFTRQLFGQKSEKRLGVDAAHQASLLTSLGVPTVALPELPAETVAVRRPKQRSADTVNDSGLRFDARVPVEVIEVPDPALDLVPELREVIGEKVTWQLAQRPGSYVVLKFVRKVIKRRDTQEIVCAPAPASVLDKTAADASLLAGLLIDKALYHLPLYRIHQRLQDAGLALARGSLLNWSQRAIELLEPIAEAQFHHVLQSRVLAMDETPIKAGLQGPGKLHQAYLWPLYGEDDEVAFRYAKTRAHANVRTILGAGFSGTLLTDGYGAYDAYAKKNASVTHAECWAHCRRGFEEAQASDPVAVEQALALIGALYRHEAAIRDNNLEHDAKLKYRQQHSEPILRAFWAWCDAQCHRSDLHPSHPLAKALKYARARQSQLQVFLSDPDVPIDTNHLERALRAIPMGRRNWLFCWTELGARHLAIIQSLMVTCRLHNVHPFAYLVDVLQRVGQHPASRVIELTPRVWKTQFVHRPLPSALHNVRQDAAD